ncbi:MAG: GNAT family N-acetyltransferase [Rhodospirillales bacterium]|nr:GNAT family N-acetyltransferase [Rhodospirillales bacterium]
MSDVRLRPGEETDIAAIAAIYAHHVLTGTASFETEAPTEEEMRRRLTKMVRRGYPYLVADMAAEVAGYAYAGPYRARPAYGNTVENSVYVRPDAMGRGIGRMLLERLVAECAARGFRQMIAVVGDSANVASIRLHEQAGFRLVGVLRAVGWKHGRWLDTVLLQRPLGDADGREPATAPG